MMVKRLTSILLFLCFVFFAVPVSGDAVEDFVVRVLEGEDVSYTYDTKVLTFTSDGVYEVSLAEKVDLTTDVIRIAEGAVVDLTINNLKISSASDSILSVAAGATCELELIGDSDFSVGKSHAAVYVPADAAITIVGDGSLKVTTENGAGIGGIEGGGAGSITINGGQIETFNYSVAAGIGGGEGGAGGSITINGGEIKARSYFGAGIGGGYYSAGGTIVINGGTIEAISQNGAGIGSGNSDGSSAVDNGSITIRDGSITAISTHGAGIGGGSGNSGGEIVILGGTIVAKSEAGAGIGSGSGYSRDTATVDNGCITISDGNISAYSEEGAGIGGGLTSSGGEIIILGGIIYAESDEGAGIGSGQYSGFTQNIGTKVTINGGTITAKALQGAGIGGGYRGIGGEVYISGGSVLASTASAAAEAIGHGKPYSADSLNSGVLLNRPGGSPVYLTVFDTEYSTATDLADGDITIGGVASGYGTSSLRTDEHGKLNLYLPAGLSAARYDGHTYTANVQSDSYNLFQLRHEIITEAGTNITTLPYFNAAAVAYTNPGFSAGANETMLTTSVSGALPIVIAKMDVTVYPEPVLLTASILDISPPAGLAAIEAIDRSIFSALRDIAPNPAILAKAEQLLVLDLALILKSDRSNVQPVSGKVTISLPIPEGYDPDKLMLAHRKSDGTIEFLDITIEAGWMTFSTDNFSNYIVIELDMPLAEFMAPIPNDNQFEPPDSSTGGSGDSANIADKTLPADTDQLPKTGENRFLFKSNFVSCAILALLVVAVVLKKCLISLSNMDIVD